MEKIKIDLLENNNGQIPNVNSNPRDLTDDGFEKAKQSIKKFPEMLEIRALVAVKYKDKYVVIGGNQRLRALKSLGYIDAPTFVVEWSCEQINEFIIKDNLEYGQWNFNLLTNEWDCDLLVDWGLDLPVDNGFDVVDEIIPDLASGDRDTLATMNFTLSIAQRDFIQSVIDDNVSNGYDPEQKNENRNGNALYYIFEAFKNG